ncbi:MAG TPA: lipid kinase [Cellvibrio sp.]|nr:lipid kinase [Cellvibrio sp.]
MTSKTTALLILNGNSRNGADADIQEGLTLLAAAGVSIIQKNSGSPEETAQLIEEHAEQIDFVILGGGDGTISSAAEALYKHQLAFAVLPLGTANDLARSLGIPNDLAEAFQIILTNNRSKINLGMINGHYFFNAAHIGLGVKVTRELTPEVKKKWGVLSYLKAAFSAFQNNRAFRATILANGRTFKLRSIQLAIGNGRYYGGGNVIDENSEIDDGLLRLYSLPPSSLWELLTKAPLLRYGKHSQMEKTFTLSSKRIEVRTLHPKEIHADGEPVSHTPAIFKVIPQALEVFRPDTK